MRRIVAAGLLAGLLLSPKLWLGSRIYPQTPVWSGLPAIPPPLDWVVYVALLPAVAVAGFRPRATAVFLRLAVVLVGVRSIPSAAVVLPVRLHAAGAERCGRWENVCRLIVISIYFWSGLQKLGGGFAGDTFPWLVEPFHGWVPLWIGKAAPFVEAGIALGLLHRATRRPAVVAAVAMHAGILAGYRSAGA